jgi:hypothetical protein
MGYEVIEDAGVVYAEIIWANTAVDKTRFFSDAKSSFQFGLLAHKAGFVEAPHFHNPIKRNVPDVQQMFVVQRGVVAMSFYRPDGSLLRDVTLRVGDAINLVDGAHSLRVIEDMQCISVKQGPFLGDEMDRVNVKIR